MGKSKKSNKKRSQGQKDASLSEATWKPLQVALEENDTAEESTNNHYDDPRLARKAEEDLPVDPGESIGMFYALEVLDAEHYKVISSGNKRKIVVVPTGAVSSNSNGKYSHQLQPPQVVKNLEEPGTVPQHVGSSHRRLASDEDSSNQETLRPSSPSFVSSRDSSTQDQSDSEASSSEQQQLMIQQKWAAATNGALLHPTLAAALARQNFNHPTPIQAATLAATILGRRNLVGAAPTGSGKTLAFLLPILQSLLEQSRASNAPPMAFIVTPTRELATQIFGECEKLLKSQCATLVGGIAAVKQKRILQTKRPPIIIGTPGRLWAMISNSDDQHLQDLSKIQFLVLDEADRMIQKHCFPQLLRILERIRDANPPPIDSFEGDQTGGSESDNDDRLLGLPGVRGEAALTMLSDSILQQIESQCQEPQQGLGKESGELGNDSARNDQILNNDDFVKVDQAPHVHRQTFIYSATLTLPFTSINEKKQSSNDRNRKIGLDGSIREILERTGAMGETKVVDLASSTTSNEATGQKHGSKSEKAIRLPPGLRLEQIKCTQRHKDSHLYAYLMTTTQGASGPCLVFCNSVAAVRRVSATLRTLGLNARMLHAHMQQRSRFEAVDSLKELNSRAVVVCTDVAARGLDIPTVTTVVHYDVARTVDAFVHRAGRTARGVGNGAVGSSLSLVSSAEDAAHFKITNAVLSRFRKVLLDGRLLSSSQERVNLASKVLLASDVEKKTQSSNKWFVEKAKEADMELDEDMLESQEDSSERELARLCDARRAKRQLAELLRHPMKTQRFGKFLTTNFASMQDETQCTTTRKNKRRKKV